MPLLILLVFITACSLPEPLFSIATNQPTRVTSVQFNNPTNHTILPELLRLINNSAPRSTIHGNIYSIKDAQVAEALLNASNRGVSVRLTLDSGTAQTEAALKLTQLVRVCTSPTSTKSACLSSYANMNAHSKFFTFSATTQKGSTKPTEAVWISSFNLTNGIGGTNGYNDAVTIYNDPALFDYLDNYSKLLWVAAVVPALRLTEAPTYSSGFISIIPSPYPKTYDPVIDFLRETVPDSKCSILVAHAWLTDGRSEVTSELIALKESGCEVRFIGLAHRMSPTQVSRLLSVGIPVRTAAIHHKFVIAADKANFRVMAGSHNLEGNSYARDDLLVELHSQMLYDAYREHFEEMWVDGTPAQ